jgi:hypothetical protein
MNMKFLRIDHEKVGTYAPYFCFLKKTIFYDENMGQTRNGFFYTIFAVFSTIFAVLQFFSSFFFTFSSMYDVYHLILVHVILSSFY